MKRRKAQFVENVTLHDKDGTPYLWGRWPRKEDLEIEHEASKFYGRRLKIVAQTAEEVS